MNDLTRTSIIYALSPYEIWVLKTRGKLHLTNLGNRNGFKTGAYTPKDKDFDNTCLIFCKGMHDDLDKIPSIERHKYRKMLGLVIGECSNISFVEEENMYKDDYGFIVYDRKIINVFIQEKNFKLYPKYMDINSYEKRDGTKIKTYPHPWMYYKKYL